LQHYLQFLWAQTHSPKLELLRPRSSF